MTIPILAEMWLPVIGYEGLYEVSDWGRVRSLRFKSNPKKVLISGKHSAGYPCYALRKKGIQKTRTVHSLVLTSFIGPRQPGLQCRHLNGNVNDNHVYNLRWGTSKENRSDAVEHGTLPCGSRHGMSRLDETQVKSIKRLKLICGWSGAEIARLYGIHKDTVGLMARNITWKNVKI